MTAASGDIVAMDGAPVANMDNVSVLSGDGLDLKALHGLVGRMVLLKDTGSTRNGQFLEGLLVSVYQEDAPADVRSLQLCSLDSRLELCSN